MMAEADTSFPKRYRNKKERFSYVLWKVYIYMKSIIFIARLLGQMPVHLCEWLFYNYYLDANR